MAEPRIAVQIAAHHNYGWDPPFPHVSKSLVRELQRTVVVRRNGKKAEISQAELIAAKLVSGAVTGDTRAIEFMIEFLNALPSKLREKPEWLAKSEADTEEAFKELLKNSSLVREQHDEKAK